MRRKQAMPYRWPYILEKQVTLIPKPSQYQWLWVLSSNRFLHILASVTFCSHIAIVLHQQLQIVFLQTRLASVEHAMLIGLGCRMTFAPATCPCKKKMTLHSGAMVWSWHVRGKTSTCHILVHCGQQHIFICWCPFQGFFFWNKEHF